MCLNIVDRLIDFTNVESTVVDRVCGQGNFLLAVIYRFVENGADIEHVVNNIVYGYDISESQIDKCRKFIKLATGINPKNVVVKDTLKMTVKKLFTYEVGNYPFNDSSEEAGRSTDKLKENTSDLDSKFYLSEKIAEKRAVIMRAACLTKSTNIRKQIFTDNSVHTIMNTSKWFDIVPKTMCVMSDSTKTVDEKKFIDITGSEWKMKTDIHTKISISITADKSEKILNIMNIAKSSNFGNIWHRSKIQRSDPRVNDKHGIEFVQTTGHANKELIIDFFDGDVNNFDNIDKWRVIVNTKSPEFGLGQVKIVKPGIATSNSIIDFAFETESECIMQKKYLESDYVDFIAKMLHLTTTNSSEFFAFVPYYANIDNEKIRELNESL